MYGPLPDVLLAANIVRRSEVEGLADFCVEVFEGYVFSVVWEDAVVCLETTVRLWKGKRPVKLSSEYIPWHLTLDMRT